MTNNTIVIEKIKELKNEYLEEILEKLQVIEKLSNAISYTDLKIHDVNYEIWKKGNELGFSENDIDNLFSFICEREFEEFQEWEQENLNYVKRDYIGRTSSFYYMSTWYGNSFDCSMVEDALRGDWNYTKDIIFGELEIDVFNALLKNDLPTFKDNEELNDFLELLEIEENTLFQLLDDANTMIEILKEANKAYNYLKDYKKTDNQSKIANFYLIDTIENYQSENMATKLFDTLMYRNSNKLNEIETINTKLINSKDTYVFEFEINNQLIYVDTAINVNSELGKTLVDLIHELLIAIINDNFTL